MKITPATLEKFIIAAIAGDQNAFTALLSHYWNEVYHFILKQTANETDAEDITIETFSKAFANLHNYKPEYAFNTWLIAIAKNVHIDLIRKRKSSLLEFAEDDDSEYHNIADESPTIEDELIQQQNLAKLLAFVKQLKPHYQEVIQLRYFQELSYKEMAEQMAEPVNNVKIKLMRAKKLLSEIILQHSGGSSI